MKINFAIKWWIATAIPLVCIFVSFIFFLYQICKKVEKHPWSKFINHYLLILNFFYFSLAGNTFSVFDCQFNGVDFIMSSENSVKCSSEDPVYSQIYSPAIVFLFFYVLGIPLNFILLLYWNKNNIIKELQSSPLSPRKSIASLSQVSNRDTPVSFVMPPPVPPR